MTFCSIFRIYLCSFFWIECILNDYSPRTNHVKNLLFHYQLMNYSCALSVHKYLLFVLFSHTNYPHLSPRLQLFFLILRSLGYSASFWFPSTSLPTMSKPATATPSLSPPTLWPNHHNVHYCDTSHKEFLSCIIFQALFLLSLISAACKLLSLLFIHSYISCANINVLQMTQSQKWISFLLVVGHRPVTLNIIKATEGRRKYCFDIGSNKIIFTCSKKFFITVFLLNRIFPQLILHILLLSHIPLVSKTKHML